MRRSIDMDQKKLTDLYGLDPIRGRGRSRRSSRAAATPDTFLATTRPDGRARRWTRRPWDVCVADHCLRGGDGRAGRCHTLAL